MCSIIYVLNILRLVVFYPIAVEDCMALPNDAACLQGMWDWHTAVWQWGFLLVLVTMWVVWFWRFGGPARTLDATYADSDEWRLVVRKVWSQKHFVLVGLAVALMAWSAYNVTSNEEAMLAKSTLDTCVSLDLISAECGNAQNRWDDAIGYAWSLAALGLVAGLFGAIQFERPDGEGRWPSTLTTDAPSDVDEDVTPKSRHAATKKGSWKNRGSEEE